MKKMGFFNKLDWLIFLPLLVIAGFGLLIIFSIDYKIAVDQVIFLIIGLILYFFFSGLDYRIFSKLNIWLFASSLILLIFTFILGRVTRGSLRWIQVGTFSFQSSEFVKPLLILSFSALACKMDFNKLKDIFIFLLFLVLPIFLIFKQPDLGSSIIVFIIWLTILFSAGLKIIYALLASITAFFSLPWFFKLLKPYQQKRILNFFNPGFDPLGSGYNAWQAIISVGSGQFWGRGLGEGPQSQLRFLPEHHTDFIFSSLSEELGLLGGVLLLTAYLVLLFRILIIALKATDYFGKLAALGVFCMIFAQVFINIAMNLGLAPITGITLPLVSAGGSSLAATMISLGIVQNIGYLAKRKKVIEIG